MDFHLHPKQSVAFTSLATEILYGGAAGGGKSHLMRVKAIALCTAIPNLQVYLFRRTSVDLVLNHMASANGFPSMLADWLASGWVKFNGSERKFYFWNGATIHLCHCEHEKNRFNYQGAEMHVLLIDEATHFTEEIYRFLRSRVRLGAFVPPKEYASVLPMILCGANPGGIGHSFVKKTFIDPQAPMEIVRQSDEEGGMLRQYIPAKLEDNPSMDADYEKKLMGLGSPELVKAMRHGDWDVVAGAFFDFDRSRHVIKPFDIPAHWTRIRGFDWGRASPFACVWAAVSDGSITIERNGDDLTIPRGALVFYREWYGMKPNTPNVGLLMNDADVAKGIVKRSRNETFSTQNSVADPSIFNVVTGESISEIYRKNGVTFIKADNSRVSGWAQMHLRLAGTDESEGAPLIYFFDTMRETIRTLPLLQHDDTNIEDLDTDQEDHAGDAVRYACMTRPIVTDAKKSKKAPRWVDPYLTKP